MDSQRSAIKIRKKQRMQELSELRKYEAKEIIDEHSISLKQYAALHPELANTEIPLVGARRTQVFLEQVSIQQKHSNEMLSYARRFLLNQPGSHFSLFGERSFLEMILDCLDSQNLSNQLEASHNLCILSANQVFLKVVDDSKFKPRILQALIGNLESESNSLRENSIWSLNNFSYRMEEDILNENYAEYLIKSLNKRDIQLRMAKMYFWGLFLLFKHFAKPENFRRSPPEPIMEELVILSKDYFSCQQLRKDLCLALLHFTQRPATRVLFLIKRGFVSIILRALVSDYSVASTAVKVMLNITACSYSQITQITTNERIYATLFEAYQLHKDTSFQIQVLNIFSNVVNTGRSSARIFLTSGGINFIHDELSLDNHPSIVEALIRITAGGAQNAPAVISELVHRRIIEKVVRHIARHLTNPKEKDAMIYALNLLGDVLAYPELREELQPVFTDLDFEEKLREARNASGQVLDYALVILSKFFGSDLPYGGPGSEGRLHEEEEKPIEL